MILRPPTNQDTSCLHCNNNVPSGLIDRKEGDFTEYYCSECRRSLLKEVRVAGPDATIPFHVSLPPAIRDQRLISDSADSIEICAFWGTDGSWSVTVGGNHVLGDLQVTKYAVHLLGYDKISY